MLSCAIDIDTDKMARLVGDGTCVHLEQEEAQMATTVIRCAVMRRSAVGRPATMKVQPGWFGKMRDVNDDFTNRTHLKICVSSILMALPSNHVSKFMGPEVRIEVQWYIRYDLQRLSPCRRTVAGRDPTTRLASMSRHLVRMPVVALIHALWREWTFTDPYLLLDVYRILKQAIHMHRVLELPARPSHALDAVILTEIVRERPGVRLHPVLRASHVA